MKMDLMLQVQHEADIEIKINKCKSVKIEKSNLIVAGLDGLDGFIGPIN